MSTLSRADEIEADFYHLKAQEWACEPDEARRLISEWCSERASEMKNRWMQPNHRSDCNIS